MFKFRFTFKFGSILGVNLNLNLNLNSSYLLPHRYLRQEVLQTDFFEMERALCLAKAKTRIPPHTFRIPIK